MQNTHNSEVLQRIGIAYMLGSIICVSFNRKTVAFIAAGILFGYWGLMYFFSDPNYPFGFHDGTKYFGIEGNIVTKFDWLILGKSHLYKGYDGIPFDPEGLLSTIPAIASVILGYFTGLLIDSKSNRKELVNYMFLYGFGALLIGYIWHFVFPINKPIWSSSYVVFMAGWCLVINAVLIWLIDIQNLRSWTKPVLVLGMNSMLAFVISGMYVKTAAKFKFDSSYETITQKWDNQTVPKRIATSQKLYEDVFCPMTTDRQMLIDYKTGKIKKEIDPSLFHDFEERQKLSSLLFALFHVVLFWAILWVFYKFNIFLKV